MSRKRKIMSGIAAIVLVLILGLSGTFAKYVGDHNREKIEGDVNVGMRLHDDYNSKAVADNPMLAEVNRDIYVENLGEADIYIRVRLNEYMEYSGSSIIAGGVKLDKSTWTPHKPSGSDPNECGTGIHKYFIMNMGGDTQYKTGDKNRYDANGKDEMESLPAADKWNTETAQVVTMDAYMEMTAEQKAGAKYWVLDPEDGYAYWSEKLPGKDETTGKTNATGLLLDEIKNPGVVDSDFFYGIYAKAEAVTESDLKTWLNGKRATESSAGINRASLDAGDMLKQISRNYIEITEEMRKTTPSAEGFDEDGDGFLTKIEYSEYLAANPITPSPVTPAP